MKITRVVEYGFFFGLLVLAGYMVWLIMQPFVSALALSAVIVTICYPLYELILKFTPRNNRSLASFVSTLLILTLIVIPLALVSTLVVREIVSFYQDLQTGELSVQTAINSAESFVQTYVPEFELDLSDQIKSSAGWLTGNLTDFFAATITTVIVFFISLLGTFYFFRDGKQFLEVLIKASPLPNDDDRIILRRLARAVRAVATGTVLTAVIQGTLAAIGFSIFGIERAILWGSIASLAALMPGIGTTIVTAPAIIYLFMIGDPFNAVGLLFWSMLVVGMVDNLIAPYLIGRGNNLHPYIVLISVLGGVALFGPIGFVLGPVVITFFLVLLEIYNQYIVKDKDIQSIPEQI